MDEELSQHVAVVLEELREVYKPFVAMYRSKMEESYLAEDRLIQSATPLLPVLITASTSALIQRRLTVKWSEDIVRPLDELAARVLCARLASDSDKVVSTHANKVVNSIEAGEAINNVRSRVMFFDSEDVLDMEVVATMLDREIEAFGEKLQISRDGAALIMQNNQYSFDKSLEKIQKSEDLERTLDACGVKHRCRSLLHRKDSNDDACSVDIVHQCKICFDDKLSQDDLYSLPCRHRFCRECFKSYLRVKMEDRSLLNCPQHGCNERIVEDDVKELLPSMLKDWKEIHLKHFIKISDQYTHCPGSDCGMICYSDTKTRDAQCTKCGRSFCFCCGNNPHTPATCRDAKEFLPLLDSSEYYVMKCSKRCPGPNCLIPIEKNQGCNYMTCSECNTSFCWLCLQPLRGHDDLERHACNKFDPRHTYNTKEKDEFFLSRYESSAEGEVYAKKGLDTFLKEKANADLCSDDDIRAMVKASECLIQCRNFLKNTYIVAWVWHHDVCRDEKTNETSATRKEIFEAHQATLAAFTDNLQQLLEKDASVIDLDGFAFFTFALRLYVERMMEFISRCREDVSR
jgi:ariadne-1